MVCTLQTQVSLDVWLQSLSQQAAVDITTLLTDINMLFTVQSV